MATTAAVEWRITVEGTDAFGEVRRHEIRVDKDWDRLFDGEIGLSVEDGKKIIAALQTAVVSQEADTYTLFQSAVGRQLRRTHSGGIAVKSAVAVFG